MQVHDLIQVAGVIDRAEADMLVECGIRFLGFPLRLPVHTEDLSEDDAAGIIRSLPTGCQGVLITYMSDAADVVELCGSLGADIVQLHGEIAVNQLRKIRQMQPRLSIIKSLVIGERRTDELRETMLSTTPYVDAFITDTFDPETEASGATGKIHDWNISRGFVEASMRPVILAGGLNPDNVKEAILAVRPAGVDAHTGLEDDSGRKSPEKVQQFVARSREAFRLVRKKRESK